MQRFFAPSCNDAIDGLIAKYEADKKQISQVADLVSSELGGVIHYFLDGNEGDRRYSLSVERLFKSEGALYALNSAYWTRALALTDVLDCMPQNRRNEWKRQLNAWKEPGYVRGKNPELDLADFEENTVRTTLQQLLGSRHRFFAERVDGIFRSLSGEHVTNSPMGFGKRMIVAYILYDWGGINHDRVGFINDLRAVIAKFMGRDEPKWNATSAVIDGAKKQWGQWLAIDGGAIRIRVYKKGTAHIEIHPDMSWRLNAVLASIYPTAIPAEFRAKPKKQTKAFQMMQRPLPFAVLDILHNARIDDKVVWFGFDAKAKGAAYDEAIKVLEAVGGVKNNVGNFVFDYRPNAVISEIVTTGSMPDQRTHQFYPSPEAVAVVAVEMADIGPNDECLEPSAGTGCLADFMPKDRTICVEISALHCELLQEKGYVTEKEDFLQWADFRGRENKQFDCIVMNPPFSEGRAIAHVTAAMPLLKRSGRLVAVLPASYRNKPINVSGDWSFTWSDPIHNAFAGTSISVAILRAEKLS